MAAPIADKTAIATLAGREMMLKLPTSGQFTLINTFVARVSNDNLEPKARMKAAGQLMSIMLSMIVTDSDREYAEDQIAAGVLDLSDFAEAFQAFKGDTEKKTTVRRAPAKRR